MAHTHPYLRGRGPLKPRSTVQSHNMASCPESDSITFPADCTNCSLKPWRWGVYLVCTVKQCCMHLLTAAVSMGSCCPERSYLTSSNRMSGSYQSPEKCSAAATWGRYMARVQGMCQTRTGAWKKGQEGTAKCLP